VCSGRICRLAQAGFRSSEAALFHDKSALRAPIHCAVKYCAAFEVVCWLVTKDIDALQIQNDANEQLPLCVDMSDKATTETVAFLTDCCALAPSQTTKRTYIITLSKQEFYKAICNQFLFCNIISTHKNVKKTSFPIYRYSTKESPSMVVVTSCSLTLIATSGQFHKDKSTTPQLPQFQSTSSTMEKTPPWLTIISTVCSVSVLISLIGCVFTPNPNQGSGRGPTTTCCKNTQQPMTAWLTLSLHNNKSAQQQNTPRVKQENTQRKTLHLPSP
jgi:hypothetical protein